MAKHLVVTNPFGDYARGARIDDPTEVRSIMASHHKGHVVGVAGDPEPEPEPEPAPSPPSGGKK